MNKISVIVPVYNKENYLKNCINSIQNQTYSNIEIMLIDDGSTDNSLQICYDLAQKDKRINVFHKENGGAASARNIGLDNARGEYIGFVDADDYIDSTMYETLLKILIEKNIPMIDSGARMVSIEGDIISERTIENEYETETSEKAIKDLLEWKGNSSFCTRLFKKEIFNNLRFPEGKQNEDFRFLIDIYQKTNFNYISNEIFYNVINSENSVTRSNNGIAKCLFDVVYYGDEVFKIIKEKYPNIIKSAWFFRFNTRLNLLVNLSEKDYNNNKKYFDDLQKWLRKNIFKIFSIPIMNKKKKLALFLACFNLLLPNKLYSKYKKKI